MNTSSSKGSPALAIAPRGLLLLDPHRRASIQSSIASCPRSVACSIAPFRGIALPDHSSSGGGHLQIGIPPAANAPLHSRNAAALFAVKLLERYVAKNGRVGSSIDRPSRFGGAARASDLPRPYPHMTAARRKWICIQPVLCTRREAASQTPCSVGGGVLRLARLSSEHGLLQGMQNKKAPLCKGFIVIQAFPRASDTRGATFRCRSLSGCARSNKQVR